MRSQQNSHKCLPNTLRVMIACSILLIFQLYNSEAQDAEIIQYTSDYTLNKNNQLSKKEFMLMQVNNRMGENHTDFYIPYSGKEKIKSLAIYLETPTGKVIRKIKKTEITEVNSVRNSMLYSDDFVMYFQPKHNSYPYRIRIEYEKEYIEFLQISRWIPVESHKIPTRSATLSVDVPEGFKLRFRQNKIDEPELTYTDNSVKYIWKAKYDEVIKPENYLPAYHSLLPYVEVLPENFVYGVEGNFSSWKSFGQWSWDLNLGLDELTFVERGNIRQLYSVNDTKIEKIKKLYYYLQDNTRYINVSIDIGGFQPYPAEYVCNNKYGDCKALTNYLKSVLSFVGIESYYALLYSDNPNEKLNIDFPNQHFNHVVLQVPLEGDTIWLECTSKTLPFGYVHSQLQNRYTLIVDDNNSHLERIEVWDEAYLSEIKYDYQVNPTGSAELTKTLLARGNEFELWNSILNSYADYEKDRIAKETLSMPGYELKNWHAKEENRDTANLSIESTFTTSNIIKTYGEEWILRLPGFSFPKFEIPSKRRLPVQIDYPLGKRETFSFSIPNKNAKITIPKNQTIETEFGKYSISYSINMDSIFVDRAYKLFPGEYSIEEYPAFYGFYQQMQKLERKNIIVIQ